LSAELPGRLNRTRGLEEFQEYKTYVQIVA
jgi:hypothetical protein